MLATRVRVRPGSSRRGLASLGRTATTRTPATPPRRGGGGCGASPLPDVREDLAAELALAGLHAGHDPSTRAHDDQPEAAEDARDLGLAGVHAEPRLADPLQGGRRRRLPGG